MPLAVTHVILTIILFDLYRDYFAKNKKLWSLHAIFIAGVGGLLPDVDIIATKIMNLLGYSGSLHGGFSHTLLFGLIFLIPGLVLFFYKKPIKKIKKFPEYRIMGFYLIIFGLAIFFHLFLDFLIGGGAEAGIMVFYPFSTATYKIFLFEQLGLGKWWSVGLDAVILLLWLWHEERKHKIKDFI